MSDAKLSYGTQLLFADHATDFGAAPTTASKSLIRGTPTDVQIDLTSLAASGGARESAKFDFGATWDHIFHCKAAIEFDIAPTDGDTVDFYLGYSNSATAGTGNPGNLTGADAAYTDSTGSLGQLDYIGSLTCRNATVTDLEIGSVGTFTPKARYGILVVVNNADQALEGAAGMDETHIVIDPLVSSLV